MPHWTGFIAFAAVLALGAIGAATDIRSGKVYNRHTYTFALAGLAFWSMAGFFCSVHGAPGWGGLAGAGEGFTRSGTALLIGFVPCMVLHFVFGLGMGDAKFIGAMGAWMASWEGVLAMCFYGLVAGLVTGLVVLAKKGQIRAFGRNLYLIFLQASAVRKPEIESAHTVPFCLPVALGAALAGAEQLLGLHLPWNALSPHAPPWLG